jgi:hypothetical protein
MLSNVKMISWVSAVPNHRRTGAPHSLDRPAVVSAYNLCYERRCGAPVKEPKHRCRHGSESFAASGKTTFMSEKHPECPLYNPLNCKEYYNPKLCAFVRKDRVCRKKKKPKAGQKAGLRD